MPLPGWLELIEAVSPTLSASDTGSRLNIAVSNLAKGNGTYGYYLDHVGDQAAGHVMYRSDGKTMRAPYSSEDPKKGNARQFVIDHEGATEVHPRVVYDAECTEKKPKESAATEDLDGVNLVESSVAFPSTFNFQESEAITPLAKIINAGRGSSGYYTPEVLKRDGPKIFKRGTLMFVNHQTAAEEAQRPEGDWNNLAAITTGDAKWMEAGVDGPGLYAPTKVFSDFSAQVKEKAPYTGLSIRAAGVRDDKALAPDGKPGIITALTHGQSIDLVTAAGRGGKFIIEAQKFLEAAQAENLNEGGSAQMNEAELKKLQESHTAMLLENRKLKERFALIDARDVVAKYFTTVRVGEAIQERVTRRILESPVPLTEAGDLDKVKLAALVEFQTKDECAYVQKLAGGRLVEGMGIATQQAEPTEEEKKRLKEAADANSVSFAEAMGFEGKGKGLEIMRGGRAAFDPTYNAAKPKDGIVAGTEAA